MLPPRPQIRSQRQRTRPIRLSATNERTDERTSRVNRRIFSSRFRHPLLHVCRELILSSSPNRFYLLQVFPPFPGRAGSETFYVSVGCRAARPTSPDCGMAIHRRAPVDHRLYLFCSTSARPLARLSALAPQTTSFAARASVPRRTRAARAPFN